MNPTVCTASLSKEVLIDAQVGEVQVVSLCKPNAKMKTPVTKPVQKTVELIKASS